MCCCACGASPSVTTPPGAACRHGCCASPTTRRWTRCGGGGAPPAPWMGAPPCWTRCPPPGRTPLPSRGTARDALISAVRVAELPSRFTVRLRKQSGQVRQGSDGGGRSGVARLGWAPAAAAALLLALLGKHLGQVNAELLRQR